MEEGFSMVMVAVAEMVAAVKTATPNSFFLIKPNQFAVLNNHLFS